MMYKGTTPIHVFVLPFDTNTIENAVVTYSQKGRIIFEKRKDDCIFENNTITVNLSQEETLKFERSYPAKIQVRVRTYDDVAYASLIYEEPIRPCLNEEVI